MLQVQFTGCMLSGPGHRVWSGWGGLSLGRDLVDRGCRRIHHNKGKGATQHVPRTCTSGAILSRSILLEVMRLFTTFPVKSEEREDIQTFHFTKQCTDKT